MTVKRNYKTLSYLILAAVIVVSFFFTNFLLNLIINDKAPVLSIFYILITILLNFGMFFIVFRLIQIIVEKEAVINELSEQFQTYIEDKQQQLAVKEEIKETNLDQLIEQAIPASPQTLGLQKFCEKILANIAKTIEISEGIMYLKDKESGEFYCIAKFAYYSSKEPEKFYEGETLPGQVAKDKKILNLSQVPDDYFAINSGLGNATPSQLVFVPVIEKDETIALLELAGFKKITQENEKFLEMLAVVIGKIVLKIK